MASIIESSAAFEQAIAPFLGRLLPDKADEILNYTPDPVLQQRIDELARKSTEGELTPEERVTYEGYVRANKFIAILQRQARRWRDAG